MHFAPNAAVVYFEPALEFLLYEQSLSDVVELFNEINFVPSLRQCIDTVPARDTILLMSMLVTIQPFKLVNGQASIAPPWHRTMPNGYEFRRDLGNGTVEQPC